MLMSQNPFDFFTSYESNIIIGHFPCFHREKDNRSCEPNLLKGSKGKKSLKKYFVETVKGFKMFKVFKKRELEKTKDIEGNGRLFKKQINARFGKKKSRLDGNPQYAQSIKGSLRHFLNSIQTKSRLFSTIINVSNGKGKRSRKRIFLQISEKNINTFLNLKNKAKKKASNHNVKSKA
jgi:hypothetical protein